MNGAGRKSYKLVAMVNPVLPALPIAVILMPINHYFGNQQLARMIVQMAPSIVDPFCYRLFVDRLKLLGIRFGCDCTCRFNQQ
jgi:hypothetical protein